MYYAIIGGTGVYNVPGVEVEEEIVGTQYGKAVVYRGKEENDHLFFLTRHGIDHSIPPHKVNYKANIAALKQLGVQRVMAINCVGSLTTSLPPGGMMLLDQFIDTTTHRDNTFFQGGDYGLGHTDMVEPYCSTLRNTVFKIAHEKNFHLLPNGTYVTSNGPRFETAAEIRLYSSWGGDVIGMTGGTEAALAREAGLHFAAVAYSINFGAGLKNSVMVIEEEGLDEKLNQLIKILHEALRRPFEQVCICDSAVHYSEKPKIDLFE